MAEQSSQAGSSAEFGPIMPYGVAIREALARGDAEEMRQVAASSREFIKDAQAALQELEARIQKSDAIQ